MTTTPAPLDLVEVRKPGARSGYARMTYGRFQAEYASILELVPSDEPEITPDNEALLDLGTYPQASGSEAWAPGGTYGGGVYTTNAGTGDDSGDASRGQE